jgi:sec-independent protein translocase protein TatA
MPLLAFGQPGPTELLIILGIVLLLFGAKKLPGLSRSLGRSLSEFKRGREDGLKSGTDSAKIETGDADEAPSTPTKSDQDRA